MQLLQNQGFTVIVIHNANNEKWNQVLDMHASESYRWSFLFFMWLFAFTYALLAGLRFTCRG
jgi:hypothetical protein